MDAIRQTNSFVRKIYTLLRLADLLATVALAQHDVEMRLRALAAKGSAARGLSLLDKLDREFRRR